MIEKTPELSENVLVETENLCEERLSCLNGKRTLQTFAASISGQWTFTFSRPGPYWRIDGFSGDLINLDKGGWIASGMSTIYASASGYKFPAAWSLEYDPLEDSILWISGAGSQKFLHVSASDSPIKWELNQDSKKLVVIARQKMPYDGVYLNQGSYIQISGF